MYKDIKTYLKIIKSSNYKSSLYPVFIKMTSNTSFKLKNVVLLLKDYWY